MFLGLILGRKPWFDVVGQNHALKLKYLHSVINFTQNEVIKFSLYLESGSNDNYWSRQISKFFTKVKNQRFAQFTFLVFALLCYLYPFRYYSYLYSYTNFTQNEILFRN